MKALVTGGDGLIGSQLVQVLSTRGWDVHPLAGEGGEFIDVRDSASVEQCFESVKPEVVFHLAGVSGPMVAADNPALVTETNAVGFINVLEATRSSGAKRVVYGASLSGHDGGTEFDPVPVTVYGATKRFGEFVLATYQRQYGLTGVSARIGAVYGKNRQTIEVLDRMLIDARERGQVTYAPDAIMPLISVHDVASCLAVLADMERPPDSCELVTQLLTEQKLAHMVADAFNLPDSSVTAGDPKPEALPTWRRAMHPHLLLNDQVQLLPESLQELI